MDREQFKKELDKLSHQQLAWFAGRCALRALPVLAYQGIEFSYWKKEKTPQHLCAIFRAVNEAWGRCFSPKYSIKNSTAEVHTAANFAASDAADITPAAYAAANAASTAAFTFVAANALSSFDYAARAIAATNSVSEVTIYAAASADIQWLRKFAFPPEWPSDLWHDQANRDELKKWQLLCESLDKGLRNFELEYWANEFQNWLKGEFDLTRIDRCLSMPKDIKDQGVEAMLTWIINYEQQSTSAMQTSSPGWFELEKSAQPARWWERSSESSDIKNKKSELHHLAIRISELEKKNQHLQEKLQQADLSEEAKQRLEQEKTGLAEQLEQQRQRQEAMEQELQAARETLQKQEEALSGRIDQSVEAISGSLVSADYEIKSHRCWSGRLRRMALALLGLALAAIVWTLCSAPDAATLGKDGSMAFYLLRISPILLLLLMAATLLRHDAKLMQELRELIRQKQQVERLTGLYKASQYARREVEESRQLAEETFGKITDHLLALQDGKSEDAKPADKDGDDSMPAILKALTELISGIKGKSP